MENQSKNKFIVIVIVIVIIAVFAWWYFSNNQNSSMEESVDIGVTEESQFTPEAINQDLDSVDAGDLDQEFKDIDADLNNL